MQSGIDVAILEIGLGGRLDAVNAFEPVCAIVTSVDLDHQEFLGNTRESIGFEKAGIYRKSVPAICGETNPPACLVARALEIHADFQCLHQDFDFEKLSENTWQYSRAGKVKYSLQLPVMQGSYQLNNAACAITAVESLQATLPVAKSAIEAAMRQVSLAGRFQLISKSPDVILDVAHNPHAAQALAENLKANKTCLGQTIAVFAMLADKDIGGVIKAVRGQIDAWYVANISHTRGALADDLVKMIKEQFPYSSVRSFNQVDNAYQQACIDAGENDKIIVFGSFFTVSSVMKMINDQSKSLTSRK
jgi:dihydrofolate synthase/folylpolyglutamate synthase